MKSDIIFIILALSLALWLCGFGKIIDAFTDDKFYCEMVSTGKWGDWKDSYNDICKGYNLK